MSNNILNSFLNGVFGPSLKSYSHASRLYVDNFYQYAPKNGWIYYVIFNINKQIELPLVQSFANNNPTIGALVKTAELPKFKMATEVLNQYNKKTYIQSKIEYTPVSLTLHDDNDNTTTALWEAYYRYYFADNSEPSTDFQLGPKKFDDQKYRPQVANGSRVDYGLNNGIKNYLPFFKSISIFQLNRQQFTGFNLVNPIITDWAHDSLNQSESKFLENKMTIGYETVQYATGKLKGSSIGPDAYLEIIYDKTPSPLGIGGSGLPNIFGGIKGVTDLLGGDTANSGFIAYPLGGDPSNSVPGRPAKSAKTITSLGGQTLGGLAGNFLKGKIGDTISKGLQNLGISSNIASRIAGAAGGIGTSFILNGVQNVLTPTKAGVNSQRPIQNQAGTATNQNTDTAQQAAQAQQAINNSQGTASNVDAATQAVADAQNNVTNIQDQITANQAIKDQFQADLDAADASGDPAQKAAVLARLSAAGYTDPTELENNLNQARQQRDKAQSQLDQATQLQNEALSSIEAEGDSPVGQPAVTTDPQPKSQINYDEVDFEQPAYASNNSENSDNSFDFG